MPITTAPFPMPNEGSNGFTLTVDPLGGTAFVTIKGILSVGDQEAEAPSIDTTTLLGTVRTFRLSRLPDEGECDVQIQYDPNDATHQALAAGYSNAKIMNWKMVYADLAATTPSHESCLGGVTKWKRNAAEEDTNTTVDFTIKFTGAVTRTAGA